ncbi:MAG: DUF1318 domain-containing protein [Terrimicrobiaceae bacterium]|nr:DUF1318 domain-containing protein [Terrimicrobiaceae bacterium]
MAVLTLAGCAGPTVNLATSEPIKVDIAMRLDVYQHNRETAKPSTAPEIVSPETARRNRMAEIQEFKNQRLVGEGRDGLLSIRTESPGEYGDYVRKTVAAENRDRMTLMKAQSDKEKVSLAEIQTRQGELWRQRSFRDEWIEVAGPDDTWVWQAKE